MSGVTDGIRDYLASGGLFNPELMDHQRVRDLVIECRDEIERLRGERDEARKTMREWSENCGAEVQRLRGELDALQTHFDINAKFEAEKYAEIERLRGLLQWWLDAGPDADWDEHEKRVREALGE